MSRARLLHLGVAAALVALLLWKADVHDVGAALARAELLPVIAVVAIDVPALFLLYVRARFVLEALGHDVPARILVPASILGNVAGSLTPASAGELLRAGVLHTRAEVSVEDALALVAYERSMSIYLLALGTGVVAAFLALPVAAATLVAFAGAVLVLLPAATAPLLRLLPGARGGRSTRAGRAFDGFLGAAGQMRLLFGNLRLLGRWGGVTATIFALNAVQTWLLARSVSSEVTPAEGGVAFGASQLAGIASLLPLGLGAADGSLAGLLREMGLSLDESAAVAVMMRLTTTLPLGVAAIASYLFLTRPPSRVGGEDGERIRRAG